MMTNDPAEGLALAQRYGAAADAWAAREPSSVSWQAIELNYSAAGRILRHMLKFDESLRAFDHAEAAQERMTAMASTTNERQPMFSITVSMQQAIFDTGLTAFARTETSLDLGRFDEAYRSITRACALFDQSARLSNNGPSDARMFTRSRSLRAFTLLKLGRQNEAATEIGVALTAAQANTIDGSATAQRDLSEAHRYAGAIEEARGNLPRAFLQFRLATETIGKLAASDPAFLLNRTLHALMLTDYGHALRKTAQPEGAAAAFKTAVSLLDSAITEAPSWASLAPARERAQQGLRNSAID